MTSTPRKSAYQTWLERMIANVKPTKKGVRIDLALYVYPDGHGNLYYLRPDGKLDGDGQPVNSGEEAIGALRKVWEQATDHKHDVA